MHRISLAIVILFLGSSAGSISFAQQDTAALVWPSPPEKARIKHIRTISSLESLKPKKGFFAGLLSLFAGEDRAPQWLVQPVGIAISPKGELVIADPGAGCIHIIRPEKHEYDFIAETKFGKFTSPVGVAFADDGKLYVSDSQRKDIIIFDDDYDADVRIADSIGRPTGIKIYGDKLYVVDTDRHRIVVFDKKGRYLSAFGKRGTGSGEYNFPVQLAAKDSLYIVDALNYRIQKLGMTGGTGLSFGRQGNVAGRFSSPKDIALDSDGNIYITDALMDNLQIFSPQGELLLVVGRSGGGVGEFSTPSGIAIDKKDEIYIVDGLNKRIQVFQYLK